MYGEFRDEARDQIGDLDAALLRVEEHGELPEEARARLLRALHTLKGNSGMLGRTEIAEAVHDLETVLKDPPDSWDRGALDAMFEMAAALRRAVERVGADDEDEALARVHDLRSAIRKPRPRRDNAAGVDGSGTAARRQLPEPSRTGASEAVEPGVRVGPADRRESPDPEAEPEGEAKTEPGEEIPEDARREPSAGDSAGEIVRVPFAALDALLNRVGELVTLETRMEALVRVHRHALDAVGLRRPLEEAAEGIARLSGSLHETTMELRLVPVRRVFERFQTVVRELARKAGKRARVEAAGGDVRIDKGMADAIGEPLLHLLRNAVDHGIERPEEREAAGKDPVGTVWLTAERLGDRVRISVEDDGKGLDRAGILARARDLGLLQNDDPLPLDAARELIFHPGFSTRAEATTVSGRGVGLDVVRRKALELRGSLSVEAPEDGGTRFVLDLPLTIAIVPAVIFEAAGEVLSFAAADVVETIGAVRTEMAGAAEVLRREDELIPVVRIGSAFGWPDGGESGARGSERFALIVRRGSRSLAVLASRLLDQRDVVLKALPARLGALPVVSGVAVTHEGAVLLLLDVTALLDLNLENHRRKNRGP